MTEEQQGQKEEADNVVEFPATSASKADRPQRGGMFPSDMPEEEKAKFIEARKNAAKAQQGQEFLLKMVEKRRHEGVEVLSHKVENLEKNTCLAQQPEVEDRLRDLSKGMGGALTSLEAINSILDYFRHDLFQVIQNLTKLEQVQFQTGAHLQTLLRLLEKKEIISEQEMQSTWQEMMPKQEAASQGQVTEEEATSEPEAEPESTQ
jgi:hypothetical protein